jgi:hypothetical protein
VADAGADDASADDASADDAGADDDTADDGDVSAASDTDGLDGGWLVDSVVCDAALCFAPLSHAATVVSATVVANATRTARSKPRSKRMCWPFVGGVGRRLWSPTRRCQLLDVRQRPSVDPRHDEFQLQARPVSRS